MSNMFPCPQRYLFTFAANKSLKNTFMKDKILNAEFNLQMQQNSD